MRSLKMRLIIVAAAWIAGGVAVAGLLLSTAFRDFLVTQFYDQLHVNLDELERLVEIDSAGALKLKSSLSGFLDELSAKDEVRLRSNPDTDPTYAIGRMIAKDYLSAMVLDRLQMYERRIEHSLCRIIKELRTLRLGPRLKGGDDAARGAADSSVRAEGFGEGCIPSEPDHRFAETQNLASLRIDDATDAAMSDCAKQTQSPASQEEHRLAETQDVASLRLDDATHGGASDCVEQSQSPDRVRSA